MHYPFLFVYGSLMLNIGSPMSDFLSKNAHFIGKGTVYGKLYDLGSYPGLIIDNQSINKVTGHVFQLNDNPKIWHRLDEYEDYRSDDKVDSLYWRTEVEVNLLYSQKICWTYVYNQSIEDLHLIKSGNYATWWQTQHAHQAFIQSNRNARS